MKRRRHLILLVFALLMFGLTLALWVRSYWQWETVYTETVYDGPPEYHYTRYLVVFDVNWGNAGFFFFRDLTLPQGRWKLAHLARPGHQVKEADAKARFPMQVASHTQPAYGRLTMHADGTFIYIADARFYGEDTFTYKASDEVQAPSNWAKSAFW